MLNMLILFGFMSNSSWAVHLKFANESNSRCLHFINILQRVENCLMIPNWLVGTFNLTLSKLVNQFTDAIGNDSPLKDGS